VNGTSFDEFWAINQEVNEQQNEVDAEREHDAIYSRAYLDLTSRSDFQVSPEVMAGWLMPASLDAPIVEPDL